MTPHTLLWIIFSALVIVLLWLDLFVWNKHAHAVSMKESALFCAGWASVALLFGGLVWHLLGQGKAMEFLAGYLVEYSLSMDNMFVFLAIFCYFGTKAENQPRILQWGILGAVIMRLILIFAGVALINRFRWLLYVFGVVLLFTGVKMFRAGEEKLDPGANPVLKLFKRFMPFEDKYDGEDFFVRVRGMLHATPLFATVIVIEASDLLFAVDSIPAVLAISRDSLIVYSSNVFAILGLRSLYFLLAGMMGMFEYLKYGIALILCFVGVKMLLSDLHHISSGITLAVVCGVLGASIALSLAKGKKGAGNCLK